MTIIYDNKTHMYVDEVNREDGTVISFTTSPAHAEKFEKTDDPIIEKIKSNRDIEIIELD